MAPRPFTTTPFPSAPIIIRVVGRSVIAGILITAPPTPLAIPPMLPLLPGVSAFIIISMPASVMGSTAPLAPLAPILLLPMPPPPFLLTGIGVATTTGATALAALARVGTLSTSTWLLLLGFAHICRLSPGHLSVASQGRSTTFRRRSRDRVRSERKWIPPAQLALSVALGMTPHATFQTSHVAYLGAQWFEAYIDVVCFHTSCHGCILQARESCHLLLQGEARIVCISPSHRLLELSPIVTTGGG
mmetsp:Transcript_11854/g.33879  ORF Transcript_11854/g.33879 Transcript_11854/m.33879 type:complete len:246 (-) Transcript_11854:596-1333(-)